MTSSDAFVAGFRGLKDREPVSTMRAALMISPRGLAISDESATDNVYMRPGRTIDLERAHAQHQAVARKIVELGVPVTTFTGREGLPDGVYPNNVFGTIPGRLIVGRMFHPGRQREAERQDVRAYFRDVLRYQTVDLSRGDAVAELTGALVVDRARGVGFHGMSQRADAAGCAAMHEAFELKLSLRFALVPDEYHTNIVLQVLAGRAVVIYKEAFRDAAMADAIVAAYEGRAIVLSKGEKNGFVGNCIAITPEDVMMSATAEQAMSDATRAAFAEYGFRVHGVEIDEIEKAGGSLRCLIAEIF